MRIEIAEVAVPATLADAGEDFLAAVRVSGDAEVRAYGTEDARATPADVISWYRDPVRQHRMLLARVDGEVAGMGQFARDAHDETGAAWFDVEAEPRFADTGVLDALAGRLEGIARAEGSRRVVIYQPTPEREGPRLTPPTGAGSVPADDPKVRWLGTHGFRLEQVERASRFPLPADDAALARFRADAEAASAAYREHRWIGTTPERWRDDMALLLTRMSTDAPSAGLEEPESVWTVQRVVDAESGRTGHDPELVTAVVEHVPTGRLAGFTRLSVPREPERAVTQFETLVLREHRGHRLGMRLKIANLQHLADTRPGHPSVVTWNAEENRHMLDVNEAVGFVPMGAEGAWRKDLD